MAEATNPKWEGKATVELQGPTADQVWPFLEDFCALDKLHPDADTCRLVEGVPGQPGLIRYCGCTRPAALSDGSDGATTTLWAKEKLLTIDPIQRCLSYEIVESNMGFKYYVGTMRVLTVEEDGQRRAGDGCKCKIEWSFVADPMEGWTLESFEAYLKYCLQSMAQTIEHYVLSM